MASGTDAGPGGDGRPPGRRTVVTPQDDLPPGASKRLTPQQRSHRARLAAHSRWARPSARQEQAEAAREALWRRFEKQVDPDGVLSEERRRQLATNAAKAHSAKMNMARQRPASE